MSELTLEERVARLEKQVSQLLKDAEPRKKDWERTVGVFAGDEFMQRVFAAALKYREADREKARRRQGRSRRTES